MLLGKHLVFDENDIEVQELLGGGRTGEVYKGRIRSTGQFVAVKKLREFRRKGFVSRCMAPEMTDDGPYSYPADVYAYGVSVWQLFWGAEPFKWSDDSPVTKYISIVQKVQRGDRFKKPNRIPEPIWTLVQDCWRGGPDSRPEFKDIVDVMLKSDAYVADGTDMDEYRDYRRRIVEETKKACEHKSVAMTVDLEGGCMSIGDIADVNSKE
jgi:serine/threonine protein kinase